MRERGNQAGETEGWRMKEGEGMQEGGERVKKGGRETVRKKGEE